MSALAGLQRDLLDALCGNDKQAVLAGIRHGALSPEARVAIYRHNVRSNWRGALAGAYPVVQRLVGAAFFDEAADRYADAFPSVQGDLHAFGASLARFLAAYPPAASLRYLPDVARLEWAWHECFHAPEAPAFDFTALAAVPPSRHEALRWHLAPAVRVIRSDYPVLAIWEANQPARDGTPDRDEGGDDVLLWRQGLEVRLTKLPAGEAEFLEACERGEPLGQAAGSWEGLPEALVRHVESGALAGFSLPADD